MMTPERTCIDAQIAAKRMLEQARPEQVQRLLEDMMRFAQKPEAAHGA